MTARSLLVTALALPLLGAGCRKATVESYRIPKEKDPEMPMMASSGDAPAGPAATAAAPGAMAGTPVATADGSGLTWSAPADWTPKPGSPMRKASFAVPAAGGEAELAITAFPGDVGGELANVNRWRGQIQLPPIAAADLPGLIQRLEHDGLKFGVVDLVSTGQNAARTLGAFVPFGGATWFFKLTGPDAVVAAAKPGFLSFLQTVKPAASTTQ